MLPWEDTGHAQEPESELDRFHLRESKPVCLSSEVCLCTSLGRSAWFGLVFETSKHYWQD